MSKKNGQVKGKRKDFAQVSNEPLQNKELSLKAKGLYALIESYINIKDWVVYKNALKKDCKEGDIAFESAWKELKDSGYLIQERHRDTESGTFYYEYELIYKKQITTPHKTHPPVEQGSGKHGVYNNTNSNNTNSSNTYFTTSEDEVCEESTFSDEGTSKISLFKLEFYSRFNQPYRKTKRTSFNNKTIKFLDIDEFPIYVRMFFDAMDNDINKCTIEYMDKSFERLIR